MMLFKTKAWKLVWEALRKSHQANRTLEEAVDGSLTTYEGFLQHLAIHQAVPQAGVTPDFDALIRAGRALERDILHGACSGMDWAQQAVVRGLVHLNLPLATLLRKLKRFSQSRRFHSLLLAQQRRASEKACPSKGK